MFLKLVLFEKYRISNIIKLKGNFFDKRKQIKIISFILLSSIKYRFLESLEFHVLIEKKKPYYLKTFNM
ncbi:MAG: hypothetical protein BAJALOKI2v1_40094 [Promethearchaeota archaeon]|nr:MAG: hypothetical protein BAJALOKI2v1_40094 [Candidatus Lokiarchaeota archaeon]